MNAARLAGQASVLRFAWDKFLLKPDEVVVWADAWLEVDGLPERTVGLLADLSVPDRQDTRAVSRPLAHLSDGEAVDPHVLIGLLARRYAAGLSADQVARQLYYLKDEYDLLPEICWRLWDDLDLAAEGYANMAEPIRELERLLKEYTPLVAWLNSPTG